MLQRYEIVQLCIVHLHYYWTELLPDWKRGILSCLQSVKVLSILVWAQVYIICWPQALNYHFGAKKGVPTLAAAQLQWWALVLSAYNYDIVYKPTQEHGNADGLSRLHVVTSSTEEESVGLEGISVLNIGQVQLLPVTAAQLNNATRWDLVLSRASKYIQEGWPKNVPDELKPYWICRSELTVEQGCVNWGMHVVIPVRFQSKFRQSHMRVIWVWSRPRS